MELVRGISVQEVLSKADPVTAPKLAVIRGLRSFEDERSNWAMDQVVRRLREIIPELAVADHALTSYNILSGVSNDPESPKFAPEDQFPMVLDIIKRCDVVLFSTRERCGFPDSNMVRFFERMGDLSHDKNPEGLPKPLLVTNKPAAVVVCGGYGSYQAALGMSGAINKLGMTVARHGLCFWDNKRGDIMKSDIFGACLELLAQDLYDLCKAICK